MFHWKAYSFSRDSSSSILDRKVWQRMKDIFYSSRYFLSFLICFFVFRFLFFNFYLCFYLDSRRFGHRKVTLFRIWGETLCCHTNAIRIGWYWTRWRYPRWSSVSVKNFFLFFCDATQWFIKYQLIGMHYYRFP